MCNILRKVFGLPEQHHKKADPLAGLEAEAALADSDVAEIQTVRDKISIARSLWTPDQNSLPETALELTDDDFSTEPASSFQPSLESRKEALLLRLKKALQDDDFRGYELIGFYNNEKITRWPLIHECDGLRQSDMSSQLRLELYRSCIDWATVEANRIGLSFDEKDFPVDGVSMDHLLGFGS